MKATIENIEKFRELYDESAPKRELVKKFKDAGLNIGTGTLYRWREAFIDGGPEEVSIVVPRKLLGDIKNLIEKHKGI